MGGYQFPAKGEVVFEICTRVSSCIYIEPFFCIQHGRFGEIAVLG